MERNYIEDQNFANKDFSTIPLPVAVYENCQFSHCNFHNCNLAASNFSKTVFRDVVFKDSKLVGLHFENCDSFLISMAFENCNLQLSSLYGLKLKKTHFNNCMLHEVDFTDADFSGTSFNNTDLSNASFYNTNLEGADLRTASNYAIDPEVNRIQRARVSINGLPGLLLKYKIRVE